MLHLAEDEVQNLIAEFAYIEGDRGVWDGHWEEIARLCLPAYSGQFSSHGFNTPGDKRTQNIFDSTAPIALGRFTAVLESMLTPRNQKWHGLRPMAKELTRNRNVRLYLDEVNSRLFQYRYAPSANFAGQNNQVYFSLGAFGTGAMFIDDLADGPGLRYRNVHLGELFLMENHQGVIDTAYRRFKLDARQARQWFGQDNLPEIIRADVPVNGQRGKKYEFLHVVKPRADVDPRRLDPKGLKWASYYVSRDYKTLIRESGYNTFPYAIGRYTQAPSEIYGRSPAMDVLPAIKTLNEEKKTMLRQGHRALDPIYLMHDDGVLDAFSAKNGAMVSGGVNADGRALVHTLPTGNIQAGEEMMKLESAPINDAFLVTIFQILVETPEMTATEVLERVREKGVLLAPTMGRQQSEYLGPMLDREIDVLSRQGLLPAMPPELVEAGGQYEVQYDSPLSRAMRMEEASGFARWTEMGIKFAVESQRPDVLDWVNIDEAYTEMGDIMAVPTRWMNGMEQVKVIRTQRQDAAQQQQLIDAAPAMSSVVKTLGGVK